MPARNRERFSIVRCRAAWDRVSDVVFIAVTPETFKAPTEAKKSVALARAKVAERNAALRKLQLANAALEDIERRMGITAPWAEDSPEYQEAKAYVKNRRFNHAVDNLERLVVQRLFELSKANLAGTGTSCSSWPR